MKPQNVFLLIEAIMLVLSLGALFGLAVYVGYRAGYRRARDTQKAVVADTLTEYAKGLVAGPPIVNLEGTELGRKFEEHLKTKQVRTDIE